MQFLAVFDHVSFSQQTTLSLAVWRSPGPSAPRPRANEPILLRALFKTHFFDSSQAERKAGWEKTRLITFLVTRSRSPWPQCGADNVQGRPQESEWGDGGLGIEVKGGLKEQRNSSLHQIPTGFTAYLRTWREELKDNVISA